CLAHRHPAGDPRGPLTQQHKRSRQPRPALIDRHAVNCPSGVRPAPTFRTNPTARITINREHALRHISGLLSDSRCGQSERSSRTEHPGTSLREAERNTMKLDAGRVSRLEQRALPDLALRRELETLRAA